MELERKIKIISDKLAYLAFLIESRAGLKMYDIHIISESFYAELFNLIFGCNLTNLNLSEPNAKAIDLIDTTNKWIVQVSSNNSKKKVMSSLKLIDRDKYTGYHFFFISISKDVSHLKKCIFKSPEGITFNPNEDCYDNKSLIKCIEAKGIDCIGKVYDYLNQSRIEMPDGNELINKINNCPKGKEGWSQFEEIGGEVFTYLFADSFRNYKCTIQETTTDGIFRRDMIVYNTFKESPSFWQLVKEDYNANLIIIDFKNYTDLLNPDQFYNPSKYMNKLAGHFAIVISRCGLNESAKKLQLKLLEEEKLIMCLSDVELINLIKIKMEGQDPLCTLEEMFYTLCKQK